MRHFITAVVYVLCVSIIYMCVHSCFWILQCLCIALYSHYMCDAVPKCWKMLYLARIRRNLFLCKLSIACACLRAHVLAPVPDNAYILQSFSAEWWCICHVAINGCQFNHVLRCLTFLRSLKYDQQSRSGIAGRNENCHPNLAFKLTPLILNATLELCQSSLHCVRVKNALRTTLAWLDRVKGIFCWTIL